MKPIELTKKHKDKLIKMCNKLFPKRNWHFWMHEETHYPDMLGHSNSYILGSKQDHYPALEIHWFEFCIIYLLDKFNYEPDILLNSCLKNTHLIDYLYKEFKKLKL